MRIIKRFRTAASAAIIMSMLIPVSFASTSKPLIPEQMLPLTVLGYDENCAPYIIQEGVSPASLPALSTANPANEDTSGRKEEDKMFAEAYEAAAKYGIYEADIEYEAQPGMIVCYGSDGKINRFIYPEAVEADDAPPLCIENSSTFSSSPLFLLIKILTVK